MVLRNYFYRLKCIVRDRHSMFWTLMFPLLLATMFHMAFLNLSNGLNFSQIKIAIVDIDEYRNNTGFVSAIEAVSNTDENQKSDALFNLKYTTLEEARKLLDDDKIEGYIICDSEIKLTVKETGINETIIKSFLDYYLQTSSTIGTIAGVNPEAVNKGLIETLSDKADYLKEIAYGKSEPDSTVVYFFSLIAMTCFYGSFWGLKEVTALQADLSYEGARLSVAPVHKMKMFISSFLAAFTVELIEVFLLISYLKFILNVSFGGELLYILLACITGTFTGVTYGTFIASVVKGGEGIKIGILIGTSMTMSFLAGLMYEKMTYIVKTNVPILAYLNPLNLISDSFYALYYYNTHQQFFINIAILCLFALTFSTITYLRIRRQRYASL